MNRDEAELKTRRRRILFLSLSLSFVWLAILGRLFEVQLVKHGHYLAKAAVQRDTKLVLNPMRGMILDARGRVLACSVPTYSVYTVPGQIVEPEKTALVLAEILGTSAEELLRKFRRKERFVWLSRSPPEEVARRIREARLPGIFLLPDVRRSYPLGWMSAHLIGAVGTDNHGLTGLEASFEKDLRGQPGWASFVRDGQGNPLALSGAMLKPPRDGLTLRLAIDSDIQCIVACRLREAVQLHGAKGGCVLVMDPRDGRILAAASEPSFQPENISTASGEKLLDYFAQRSYEPGSVFKGVTLASVFEEGQLDPAEEFPNEGESFDFGGFRIHDAHPFRHTSSISLCQAIAHSSNIITAKLAMRIGEERFFRHLREFGFGRTTGLPIPGEAAGILRDVAEWSSRSVPTLAIGQEVSVTAIQLAVAYCAIANGGLLYKPYVVEAVEDEEGNVVQQWGPTLVRRVMSEQTAYRVRELLCHVVEEGTGREARTPWTTVAGKTGTAQKFDPVTGTYKENGFVSSFIGFAPAEDPTFLCLVVIDEPQGDPYGGKIAAPVFRKILESVSRTEDPPAKPRYRKLLVSLSKI